MCLLGNGSELSDVELFECPAKFAVIATGECGDQGVCLGRPAVIDRVEVALVIFANESAAGETSEARWLAAAVMAIPLAPLLA